MLVLAPRSEADAALATIQSMTVTGAAFVQEVEIRKAAGDWEKLLFTDHAVSTAPLRAEDSAALPAGRCSSINRMWLNTVPSGW